MRFLAETGLSLLLATERLGMSQAPSSLSATISRCPDQLCHRRPHFRLFQDGHNLLR